MKVIEEISYHEFLKNIIACSYFFVVEGSVQLL